MDNAAEDKEQFGLMIAVPSEIERLTAGPNAVGMIQDSSGRVTLLVIRTSSINNIMVL